MKIAFLTPEYITEKNWFGGLSNYVYKTATGLKNRGHYVEVFVLSDKNEQFLDDGILINRFSPNFLLRTIFLLVGKVKIFPNFFKTLIYAFVSRKEFLKRNKKISFDILQISSYGSLGLFLTKNKKITVINRLSSLTKLMRSLTSQKISLDDRLCDFIEIKCIEDSKSAYAPSKFLSKMAKKVTSKKIYTINPPFDKNKISSYKWSKKILNKLKLDKKKYILYFGSIHPLKGLDLIFSGMDLVLDKYINYSLVLVGSKYPKYNKFIESKKNKWGERFKIIPPLHHSDLFPIIKKSEFVVLPSLMENYSNACIESMALSKIVLATKNTSSEELIDDSKNGFLIETNNLEEYLDKIDKIINLTKKDKKEIERKSQLTIKKLSPKLTLKKLEEYYYEVIND